MTTNNERQNKQFKFYEQVKNSDNYQHVKEALIETIRQKYSYEGDPIVTAITYYQEYDWDQHYPEPKFSSDDPLSFFDKENESNIDEVFDGDILEWTSRKARYELICKEVTDLILNEFTDVDLAFYLRSPEFQQIRYKDPSHLMKVIRELMEPKMDVTDPYVKAVTERFSRLTGSIPRSLHQKDDEDAQQFGARFTQIAKSGFFHTSLLVPDEYLIQMIQETDEYQRSQKKEHKSHLLNIGHDRYMSCLYLHLSDWERYHKAIHCLERKYARGDASVTGLYPKTIKEAANVLTDFELSDVADTISTIKHKSDPPEDITCFLCGKKGHALHKCKKALPRRICLCCGNLNDHGDWECPVKPNPNPWWCETYQGKIYMTLMARKRTNDSAWYPQY
jgi:hypothetical protein